MRILTICPTFKRPELASQMSASWFKTSTEDNTLALGCDIGDPKLSAYKDIKSANKIFCKAGSTVTEVINSIYVQHPNYDFYHITNDDVIYHTHGWDSKFVNLSEEYGHGIFYGNDLLQGANLCTFPFISAPIVKAVGWLQLPTLNRYAGDVVWKFLGQSCNCLYYMGGVVIQHNHNGKIDKRINKGDMGRFAKWLPSSNREVNAIKGVL